MSHTQQSVALLLPNQNEDALGNPGLSAEVGERLRALAAEAAANSYSPYSRFKVGAALLLEDGSIVTGCNVENAAAARLSPELSPSLIRLSTSGETNT